MEPLTLTNSEWYVLDSLWERSPMTVMELVSALHEKVGWAKSTTITTLRRMEGKGLLHCQVEGRTRHYTPAVERQSAARQETRSFLDRDEALSREDLDQLYEILRQAEEGIT